MRTNRIFAILLTLALLLPRAGAVQQPAQDGMRGVWVSTVYNIDYPSAQGLTAGTLLCLARPRAGKARPEAPRT